MGIANWITIALFFVVNGGALAVAWGKLTQKMSQIERDMKELEANSVATYVRKDYYDVCHQGVVEAINKLNAANIDVRLAKIETQQEQILAMLEELRRRP
jgi:hypothetical protein